MHELFNTFNSFIIDIDMQMPGKLLSHNDLIFLDVIVVVV